MRKLEGNMIGNSSFQVLERESVLPWFESTSSGTFPLKSFLDWRKKNQRVTATINQNSYEIFTSSLTAKPL